MVAIDGNLNGLGLVGTAIGFISIILSLIFMYYKIGHKLGALEAKIVTHLCNEITDMKQRIERIEDKLMNGKHRGGK